MQESAIYQEILKKGEARGEIRGKQEGKKEGETTLITLALTYRFGMLPTNVRQKIRNLSTSEIEELMRAQLDFSTLEDVANWLEQQS